MQISWISHRCLGTGPHRGPGIWSDQVQAQAGDDRTGVVSVQTVEGQAVVEQGRCLAEDLSRQLEIDLGPRP